MKHFTLTVLVTLLFISFSNAQIIELEPFGPTLNKPVGMKHAGDTRLFVHEQGGVIKIINADGSSPSTPFLDITSIVNSGNFERGLLGLAFHPNYAVNGYFYVHYTDIGGTSIIARYTVSADPNVADPASELVILSIPQPYDAHQGGDLNFDSNGYLFVALGDGGAVFDIDDRSQDLSDILGNMLRIDVDNPSGGNNYGIPPGNPFVETPTDDPNTLAEIWHYGLRNPAKFSFDSLTGDMWISDTGQEEWEEIDLNVGNVPAANYGWPCYEGNHITDYSDPVAASEGLTYPAYCSPAANTNPPVAEYNHNEADGVFRCASIGGYRYRGTLQSNLYGIYFYADFCSSNIFMLADDGLGGWTETRFTPPGGFFTLWTGFGEDVNGELYIFGQVSNQVYKIKQETLSTNTIDHNLSFKMVPNPTSNGQITISFPKSVEISSIIAYNIQGQIVKTVDVSTTLSSIDYDITNLKSGIYIIEVANTSGEKMQKRLIVN